MCSRKHFPLFVLLVFILSACAQEMVTAEPQPTPEFWRVYISPAVGWLEDDLRLCEQESGYKFLFETSNTYPADGDFRLEFYFGDQNLDGDVFVFAKEELLLIVNPQNPLPEIGKAELLDIYLGEIKEWQWINPSLAELGEIEYWIYPQGTDLEKQVSQSVIEYDDVGLNAMIAPNPEAMLQAIGENPSAIGILPASWLDDSVIGIDVNGLDIPEVPVLLRINGVSLQEAQPVLNCLQIEISE